MIDFFDMFPSILITWNVQQIKNFNTKQILSARFEGNCFGVIQKSQNLISWVNQNSKFSHDCIRYQERGATLHNFHSDPALLAPWNAQCVHALKRATVAETKIDR